MDSEVATRIGLKTYLEITSVWLGVSEAAAGDTVYIMVRVRNNHTEAVYATVKFAVNGIEKQGAVATLQAGKEYSWPLMSFVMPNKSVQGTMAAFYWTGTDWIMDDEQTFSVALAGAPPVALTGRIESPRIKYNFRYVDIPQVVPYGENFRVAFTGRNTSSVNVKLWGKIHVYDPDRNEVLVQEDWEGEEELIWPVPGQYTGPNGTHNFSFPLSAIGTIPVNMAGEWTARMILAGWDMVSDEVPILDDVTVVLFNSLLEALEGTIVKKQLEYPWGPGGKLYDIPAADVPIETKALLHVWGRNDTDTNQRLGCRWRVQGPPGSLMDSNGEAWEFPGTYTGPGGQHHFIFPGGLNYLFFDKEGPYTVKLELLMNPDDPVVVDDFEGDLCTVSVEVKYVGEIRNVRVDVKPLWPGGEYAIPHTEPVEVGQTYNIGFDGCNLSPGLLPLRLRGDIWIISPSGKEWHHSDVSTAAYPLPGLECHPFIFKEIPAVDEEGEWRIRLQLSNSTGEYELARWPEEGDSLLFSTQILLKGDVGGHVRDAETGLPIEGAVVTVDETGQSDTTSAADAGTYLIRDVPQGNYTLTARAPGYESVTESDVTVTSEKLTIVDFMLAKAVAVGIPTWMTVAGVGVIVAAIGALVYISRPEPSMKLGEMLKCESAGKFISGWYGEGIYKIEIYDAPKAPRRIIEKGGFSNYASFRKAFDRACATGTIKEKGIE